MLSGHLADAHHPDCIWGDRLIVEGCVHKRAGAGGRSLVVFRSHRIVSLQERLRAEWEGLNQATSWFNHDTIQTTLLLSSEQQRGLNGDIVESQRKQFEHLHLIANGSRSLRVLINEKFISTVQTWKWGSFRIRTSSSAAWLLCMSGLSSFRMSWTSSTLFSLTASSLGSSNLSWALVLKNCMDKNKHSSWLVLPHENSVSHFSFILWFPPAK